MLRNFLCVLVLAATPFVALAQEELTDAFTALKAAEQKKDTAEVRKQATACLQLSRGVLKTAQPSGESELKAWKASQAYAKEVKAYGEYALDVVILAEPDNQKKAEIFETLEKASPDSEYLPQLHSVMLGVYAKMKPDKSYPFAQRAIGRDPNNGDLLLVLAAGAYERKQFDNAITFSNRLVKAVGGGRAKPEGVPTGDWEFRRTTMLGRGYWYAGMAYAAQSKHPLAAESLKESLPYLKGEPQLLAGAQFYIGVSDYSLARVTREKAVMQEALKYSDLAAKSGTNYAQMASQNAYAIRNELARMR